MKCERVKEIKIGLLDGFYNHPFKLYQDERFDEMVKSILNQGIITPIIVREKGNRYEILSGHNRVNAAKTIGLKKIPAIIKEGLNEAEATLIVTETNLIQRSFSELLYSERAAVIATRHYAMKKQGYRSDLINDIKINSDIFCNGCNSTYCPLGNKLKTIEKVGDEFGLSARSIARYLRIDLLSDELKCLLDEGKISVRAAVDLSYISKENQEMVGAIISENRYKIDMKKAIEIRKNEELGELNWKKAIKVITGATAKKDRTVRICSDIINKYFDSQVTKNEIEKIIEESLGHYLNK